MGISVRDLLTTQQTLRSGEVREHVLCHLMPLASTEVSEAVKVEARFINWRNRREPLSNTELMVIASASRSNVHDAGPLFGTNVVPSDHAVCSSVRSERFTHGGQVIKRGTVLPTDQLRPFACFKKDSAGGTATKGGSATRCANPELAAVKLNKFVIECGMHSGGNIRGYRPWRGCPRDELFAWPIHKCQPEIERRIFAICIPLGHLMLTDPRAAAGAPRHAVAPLVEPAARMTRCKEGPDQVVILIGEGEVRTTNLWGAESPNQLLHWAADRTVHTSDRDRRGWTLCECITKLQQLGWVIPVHPHAEPN